MLSLIKKEFILVGVVWILGLLFFFIADTKVVLMWTIFCLVLGILFISGSVFLMVWSKKHRELKGLIFAGFSFFNQLLFLLFLFIFLEPQEHDHRMIAIAGLVGYLASFLIDTRWKLKKIQEGGN
jgi:O-antigen/teichoic acid export membrane protein